MNNIEIRQPSPDELVGVQQLRHTVLDPARSVEVDHELTPQDCAEETIHMAAFVAESIVGTVRLDRVSVDPDTYEVRKMAVDPKIRGRGVGKLVLGAALAEARLRDATGFTLDAREEAIPFFEKSGFRLTGVKIVHADGVPNYVMVQTVAAR